MEIKSIKLTLLLIALSFDPALSKTFEFCEFAQELFLKHDVPLEEVYMHLCIGSTLHTGNKNHGSSFLGIYAIGSQWWCGNDSPGGSCNVKCSDLLDDDIADDVACANKILSSHGLQGWHLTEASCKRLYEEKAEECLAEVEILSNLIGVEILNTTTTSSTATTFSTTTTTTTRPAFTSRTTSRTSTQSSVDKISAEHQKIEETVKKDRGSSVAIIIVIASLVLLLVATVLVVKREQVKRYLRPQRDHEFENALII